MSTSTVINNIIVSQLSLTKLQLNSSIGLGVYHNDTYLNSSVFQELFKIDNTYGMSIHSSNVSTAYISTYVGSSYLTDVVLLLNNSANITYSSSVKFLNSTAYLNFHNVSSESYGSYVYTLITLKYPQPNYKYQSILLGHYGKYLTFIYLATPYGYNTQEYKTAILSLIKYTVQDLTH